MKGALRIGNFAASINGALNLTDSGAMKIGSACDVTGNATDFDTTTQPDDSTDPASLIHGTAITSRTIQGLPDDSTIIIGSTDYLFPHAGEGCGDIHIPRIDKVGVGLSNPKLVLSTATRSIPTARRLRIRRKKMARGPTAAAGRTAIRLPSVSISSLFLNSFSKTERFLLRTHWD